MSVFVIKGVPVVKLVSPTVYGQASQPDHAFNNASGHFEKNNSWLGFTDRPSLKWLPV